MVVGEVSKLDNHKKSKIIAFSINLTVDCGRCTTEKWMEFL